MKNTCNLIFMIFALIQSGLLAGDNWEIFAPDKIPPGEILTLPKAALLERPIPANRKFYLVGDFVVTAWAEDRIVMRTDPMTRIRLIASYPEGVAAPPLGSKVSRDSTRPYQITDISSTSDGQTNVSVREIVDETESEQWRHATGFRLPKISSECVIQIYHLPKEFWNNVAEVKFPVVDKKLKIVDLRPWCEYIGLALTHDDFAFVQKDTGLCIIGTTKQNHDLIRSLADE